MGEHAYEVLQKLGEQKSEAYRELEPWLLPKLKGGGRQGSQGM
jgi:hypothetical protein